ncbi:DUF3016 domain-containing protein [Pigmentiphaga aceris]|uniref:DUF3016 domain-containing protein n=1 Tax=Pigmentiphaga aceris TaxID=1940612 RepID=A0A5C0B4J4_9BURK|nr:DUF3016 domain-containing protein [Pigmentiphaga aceris]QEI07751.1 DUF3016 domain-containing protein [Pigmentiphaga aceris]
MTPIDTLFSSSRAVRVRWTHPLRRFALASLTAMLLGTTAAHAGTADQVDVQYVDPDNFTEFRHAGVGVDRNERGWLNSLARHIAQRVGGVLPAGQHMTIVVTDVDRAGDYEPWHGGQSADVRIVRDIYPPSITLSFTLLSADGTILRAGQTRLRDTTFMMRMNHYSDDPLRYEKALIDDWVSRAFPAG